MPQREVRVVLSNRTARNLVKEIDKINTTPNVSVTGVKKGWHTLKSGDKVPVLRIIIQT